MGRRGVGQVPKSKGGSIKWLDFKAIIRVIQMYNKLRSINPQSMLDVIQKVSSQKSYLLYIFWCRD